MNLNDWLGKSLRSGEIVCGVKTGITPGAGGELESCVLVQVTLCGRGPCLPWAPFSHLVFVSSCLCCVFYFFRASPSLVVVVLHFTYPHNTPTHTDFPLTNNNKHSRPLACLALMTANERDCVDVSTKGLPAPAMERQASGEISQGPLFLSLVLGSKGKRDRFLDSHALLEWAGKALDSIVNDKGVE